MAPLPPGLRVAGMRSRIGAWLIDSLILVAFQMGFLTFALVVGAIRVNPEAERQLQASPLVLPSVPPYDVNLPLLAVLSVVFVALNVAYAAVCWARWRGMPGQRLMSLQVGSAETGRNLSYGRALARSVVAVGIPIASLAGVLYGGFAFVSSVPWSEVTNPLPGGKADAWLAAWSGPLDVATLMAVTWPVVLLIWTAANPVKQGLHDRLAGSLVVGKGAPPWADAMRRPGYWPGFVPPEHGLPPGYWTPSGQEGLPGYGPPPGALLPGALLPGALPPGALPPGALPPDALPPGAWPLGAVPPGALWPGAQPGDGSPETSPDDPGSAADQPGSPTGPAGQPETPVGLGTWRGGWTDPYGSGPDRARGADDGTAWVQPEDASDAVPTRHAATVGRRVAAYLLDCVIVYMVFALLETAIVLLFLPTAAATLDERTYILLGLVGGVWQLAYFTIGWAVLRGTIGQRLMHMRVTDVTTGKALSWMDAVVRWAILQGPFALATIAPEALRFPVLLAAPVWAMFLLRTTTNDSNLRGLHDRFLNSRVMLEP